MNTTTDQLDLMADAIERIANSCGVTLKVTGGTVRTDAIMIETVGDMVTQECANRLAGYFHKRIPIYDSPDGDVIEVTR